MKNMSFGLNSYNYLLDLIINSKKQTIYFTDFKKGLEGIINRHDVDFCPKKAHQIAKIEFKKNIRSTFFFLVNSPLYSIYKKENIRLIKDIINMEHKIGLHFDPEKVGLNMDIINYECKKQINILENLLHTLYLCFQRFSLGCLAPALKNCFQKNFFQFSIFLSQIQSNFMNVSLSIGIWQRERER